MAHFAEIDDNNIVVRVLVVPDEQEHRGQEFMSSDLNLGGRWIQTSYNNRIRKQFAGIGMTYDESLDMFIQPQPFASWSLNSNGDWEAPIPKPDGANVAWNEEAQRWVGVSMIPEEMKSTVVELG